MIIILILAQSLIFGLLKKFQRTSGLLTFMTLGFYSGIADIRHNADYKLYLASFDMKWSNFEQGYTYFSQTAKNYGVTYENFRLAFCLITYFILFMGIVKLTENVALVSFLYGISMYPLESIQVRNTLMIAIITWMVVVLKKDDNWRYFVAIIIVWISSLFHSLGLIFIVIPIFTYLFRNREFTYYKYASLIIYGLSIIFVAFGKGILISLSVLITKLFSGRESLANNLTNVYSNSAVNKVWIAMLVLAIIISLFPVFNKKSIVENEILKVDYRPLLWMLILAALSILLMTVTVDYIRLIRNVSLFYFIWTVIIFNNEKISVTTRYFNVASASIIGIVIMVIQVFGIYKIGDQLPYIMRIINQNIIIRG